MGVASAFADQCYEKDDNLQDSEKTHKMKLRYEWSYVLLSKRFLLRNRLSFTDSSKAGFSRRKWFWETTFVDLVLILSELICSSAKQKDLVKVWRVLSDVPEMNEAQLYELCAGIFFEPPTAHSDLRSAERRKGYNFCGSHLKILSTNSIDFFTLLLS